MNFNGYGARSVAFIALYAAVFIYLDSKKTHFIKQRIYGSERAGSAAKRSLACDHPQEKNCQNNNFNEK